MLSIAAIVVHVALYGLAAVGCVQILRAGLLERRGLLERATGAARRGGFTMAGGTLSTVASWPLLVATLPAATRRALLSGSSHALEAAALAMILTVVAGFVGLLAGLTGKPRPSGVVAALLFAAGVAANLFALGVVWWI